MSRNVIMSLLVVLVLTLGATAQEQRSEIGLQGTGFFTKDSHRQGISQHATDTGGLLVSYRYWFNRWIATQADYGYNRNTLRRKASSFTEAALTFRSANISPCEPNTVASSTTRRTSDCKA